MSSNNYLTPEVINDSRLTPTLKLLRNGSKQEFRIASKRTWDPDFTIEPPMKHIFAKLIVDMWFWVNGCDHCNGKEEKFGSYKRCETHDVCHECKTPRSKLTETPWGHQKGFWCKPCHDNDHERQKAEALAAMGEYDDMNYYHTDELKCPYCDFKYDDHHEFCDGNDFEPTCPRCDSKFSLTVEYTPSFTTERIDE